MATTPSTNLQRLYMDGAASRFALFQIRNASTSDTTDLSTSFTRILNAAGMSLQAAGTVVRAALTVSGLSSVSLQGLTGTTNDLVWLLVAGTA